MKKMVSIVALSLLCAVACLPVAAESLDGTISVPTPAGSADPFAVIVFAVCLLVAGAVVVGAIAVLRKKGREAADEMEKADSSEEKSEEKKDAE